MTGAAAFRANTDPWEESRRKRAHNVPAPQDTSVGTVHAHKIAVAIFGLVDSQHGAASPDSHSLGAQALGEPLRNLLRTTCKLGLLCAVVDFGHALVATRCADLPEPEEHAHLTRLHSHNQSHGECVEQRTQPGP